MSDTDMTNDAIAEELSKLNSRFDKIDARMQHIEENMVRKSDVFQSVLTVQGFTFAIVVGVIVVLNAVVGFAG